MLELTGMGSVLRGLGVLYWLLAIGAVGVALFGVKGTRKRAVATTAAIVLFGFLPGKAWIESVRGEAYAREAWSYFKKKCETESGERIYKTFDGVKSVLVIKPLPPATEKDLFDQFWYGDPYSDTTPWDRRGEQAAVRLIGTRNTIAKNVNGKGFDFVEIRVENGATTEYLNVTASPEPPYYRNVRPIEEPVSRFGLTWEDTSTPQDRQYWIARSRLRITDLGDKSVVAERVGFLIEAGFGSTTGGRRPWLSARGVGQSGRSCPPAHDYADRWFIFKALRPAEGD